MRVKSKKETPEFDLDEYNRRSEVYNTILEGMEAGLITADNISKEQLDNLKWMMGHQIRIHEVVTPFGAKLLTFDGVTSLREGWQWLFATDLETQHLRIFDPSVINTHNGNFDGYWGEQPHIDEGKLLLHTWDADGKRRDFDKVHKLRIALLDTAANDLVSAVGGN